MLMSSGLAAVTAPLQACLKGGDHVLMVDSVYGPARIFCEKVLTRCGVATTYYDPLIGEGIAKLMRPNTKVVYTESPGSLTFEVQDIPAIAAAAHAAGAKVLMDNTWASPWLFPSFARGVDVSIHAATKYIVGHSDAMLGAVITTEEMYLPVRTMAADLGHSPVRMTPITHCAACAPCRCGSNGTRRTRSKWRAGCDPARSVARALSGPARRSGPRLVEARFPRRQRPFRHRA